MVSDPSGKIEHLTASFALLTYVGAPVDFIKIPKVYALFASTFFIWAIRISDEFHYNLILLKYLKKNVFLFVRCQNCYEKFHAVRHYSKFFFKAIHLQCLRLMISVRTFCSPTIWSHLMEKQHCLLRSKQ